MRMSFEFCAFQYITFVHGLQKRLVIVSVAHTSKCSFPIITVRFMCYVFRSLVAYSHDTFVGELRPVVGATWLNRQWFL
jgi:hypothetical protein